MQNKSYGRPEKRAVSTDQIRSRSKPSLKINNQDVKLPVKARADVSLSKLLNIASPSNSKKSFDLGSLTPLNRRSSTVLQNSSFQTNSNFMRRSMSISSSSTPTKCMTPSMKFRTPMSKFFPSNNNSKVESLPVSANVSQPGTPVNQNGFSFTIRNQLLTANASPELSMIGDHSPIKHSKTVTFSVDPKIPETSPKKDIEKLPQNFTNLSNLAKASLILNSTPQPETSLLKEPRTPSKVNYNQDNFYNLRRRRQFIKESNTRETLQEKERDSLLKYFKDPVKIAQVTFKQLDVSAYHKDVAINPVDLEIIEEKETLRKLYNQFRIRDQKGPLTPSAISQLELTKKFSQLKFFNRVDSSNFVNNLKSLQIYDYTSSQSIKEYFQSRTFKSKLWMTDPQKLKRMQKNFFKERFRNRGDRHSLAKKMLHFLTRLNSLGLSLVDITEGSAFGTKPYHSEGSYVFIKAIKHNNVATVRDLLQYRKYLVYDFDEQRRTGLHWACIKGNKELVNLLLEYRSEIDAVDMSNMTPFHYALRQGEKSTIFILLYNRARPWSNTEEHFYSIVHDPEIKKWISQARQFDFMMRMSPPLMRRKIWQDCREKFDHNHLI